MPKLRNRIPPKAGGDPDVGASGIILAPRTVPKRDYYGRNAMEEEDEDEVLQEAKEILAERAYHNDPKIQALTQLKRLIQSDRQLIALLTHRNQLTFANILMQITPEDLVMHPTPECLIHCIWETFEPRNAYVDVMIVYLGHRPQTVSIAFGKPTSVD